MPQLAKHLAFKSFSIFDNRNLEESPHPIYEFLFGFEEEGYVYYPIWHRDYFFFIVGFALLLLLLLVVLLVVNARDKKKLAMQHALLKEANAQVTASIQYASRIQQALLTDVDQAKALLPDFGLLFKPRDIVSGDFYWISEVEDKIFVLGMDCTGHGVPGAFLTLLAFQEVRQIVFERRLQAPGEVLFALHQQFLVHMKASKSEQSDGAEVALCVLDKKGKKLTYSGAKMDL